MARTRSFLTAAARRAVDPPEWVIDGQTFRLDASADLALFAELLDLIQAPAESEGVTQMQAVVRRRDENVALLARFVRGEDRQSFIAIGPLLDVGTVNDLNADLIEEFSAGKAGAQSSLSDGSEPSTTSSTDGAPPEV